MGDKFDVHSQPQILIDDIQSGSTATSPGDSNRANPRGLNSDPDYSSRSNSLSPHRTDVVATIKSEFDKMNAKLTNIGNQLQGMVVSIESIERLLILNSCSMVSGLNLNLNFYFDGNNECLACRIDGLRHIESSNLVEIFPLNI